MNFDSVINSMDQQSRVLKDLQNLLDHNERQPQDHSVNQEEIESLQTYVTSMKRAVDTAVALAKHYKAESAPAPKDEPDDGEKAEKPKKKRSSARKEPAEKEPANPPPVEEADPPADDDFDFLN